MIGSRTPKAAGGVRTALWRYVATTVAVLALLLVALSILRGPPSPQIQDPAVPTDPAGEVGFLTGAELRPFLSNGRHALVEFGGRSCIPCRQMQPVLAELKRLHGERLDIVNVYLDQEPEVAAWFGIMVIPTQIVFDEVGNILARHVGIWPRNEIEAELRRLQILP